MNKGIIIEKHINYSVVLTRNGSFEKAVILDHKADIGEEVFFRPYRRRQNFIKRWRNSRLFWPVRGGITTAIIAILIVTTSYFIGESKTYAYITIDINPSIEVQVNEDMQVQNISPMNEEAEQLLSKLPDNSEGDLYKIIDVIMNLCDDNDIPNEEKQMFVGISYTDDSHQLIGNNLESNVLEQGTNWDIISFNIPPEIRERAINNNRSMNKEFAILMYGEDDNMDIQINLDQLKMESIHAYYYEADD